MAVLQTMALALVLDVDWTKALLVGLVLGAVFTVLVAEGFEFNGRRRRGGDGST